jgi:antirestriction protein ArdC
LSGISVAARPDHADYIGHWLRIPIDDRKAIFTAASASNKAPEYLKSIAQIEQREAA